MSDPIVFPRSMSQLDTMFWRMQSDPTLRATTVAVAVLGETPSREAVEAVLRRACDRIPRLRQRVVELPGGIATPLWSEAPHFDLAGHLRRVAAPGDASLDSVFELAASIAMQGFDPGRPLWEFLLVEGLGSGRAALVQKLHHAVTDGAAGLALIGELYELAAEAPEPATAAREAGRGSAETVPALVAAELARRVAGAPGEAWRAARTALDAATRPLETAREIAEQARAVGGIMRSGPGPLSPILRGRSSRSRFAGFSLPVADLEAGARAAKASFNDAFLAGVIGGFRLYHEREGAPARQLRFSIPISRRPREGSVVVGNQLAIARLTAAVDETDPRRRMRAVGRVVREAREPASLAALELVATLANQLPLPVALRLMGDEMRKSDFVATALPGVPESLRFAGAPVEALFGFGPPAGAAANVTLVGYGPHAHVALHADPAAVRDTALLAESLRDGLHEVVKLG